MKTKNLLLSGLLMTGMALSFTSCDPKKEQPATPVITTGTYVLNEGSWMKNNASLTYYDLTSGTATSDIFILKAGKKLGDTGQDALLYGSKLYIVVNGSSTIQVMDAKSAVFIKSIAMTTSTGEASSPRNMAAYNGNIYISQFDGTVACLDTTSLAVTKTVKVGPNPEGIAIANGKLYVAISGGLNPVNDSTVSVINTSSFTVEKNIVVGLNPINLVADASGNVFVVALGDYAKVLPSVVKIDGATGSISKLSIANARDITVDGNNLFVMTYSYGANSQAVNKKLVLVNSQTSAITSNSVLASDSIVKTPYCLDINPITKDIYIGETDYSTNGKMYCFDKAGKLKFTFETGVSPKKTIFLTNK